MRGTRILAPVVLAKPKGHERIDEADGMFLPNSPFVTELAY
jgi:hypothetical protein